MKKKICLILGLLILVYGTALAQVAKGQLLTQMAKTASAPFVETLNPADKSNTSLTNGNLTATNTGGSWASCRALYSLPAGRWYWEVNTLGPTGAYAASVTIGMATAAESLSVQLGYTDVYGYGYDGGNGAYSQILHNGVLDSNQAGMSATTDVVMFAYDTAGGYLWVGLNGTWFTNGGGVGNPAAGTYPAASSVGAGPWFPTWCGTGYATMTFNFGATAFAYTPPSGFTAVNH